MTAQFSGQMAPAGNGSTMYGASLSLPADVALVRWPQDSDSVAELRALGRPRLLLVEPATPAPMSVELDEDWIRLPASEEDLHARSVALVARAAAAAPRPAAVGDGRLVHRGEWVALSPIEEGLIAALVADFGELVTLEQLSMSADGHELSPNAIRVHVMRLRKRIRPLGLVVRTVHGRGYLIESAG